MDGGIDRRAFLGTAAGGLTAFALTPELHAARRWLGANELRVGVIGAGRQGRRIIGELQKIDGAVVAGICEIDRRRRMAATRRASGAEAYESVEEMLKAGTVDAVVVATPTHTHREVAIVCMEAGVHVYVECPLAHTLDDCEALAAAAASAKGVVAAGLQGRSNPVYQHARNFFRSDSVRDLVSMRAQHHRKSSWVTPTTDAARFKSLNWRLDPEVSLGLAGEFGTQQFDVFHWYIDRYPTRVGGLGSVRLHDDGREVADTIAMTLEFDDGAALQYQASLANSYEGTHEVLFGTNAAIKLAWSHGWMFKEADAPTQGWEVYANRQQFHNDEGITLIADATKLAAQGKLKDGVGLPYTPEYYALSDWIAAIGDGSQAACSIAEAARATAVGIAANRAIVTGSAVDVVMPNV
mgnify:CR=1 FL=1